MQQSGIRFRSAASCMSLFYIQPNRVRSCPNVQSKSQQSDAEFAVQDSNSSLILTNNVELLVRNILRLLLAIWTLAASTAVALVVRNHTDGIGSMDQVRNVWNAGCGS